MSEENTQLKHRSWDSYLILLAVLGLASRFILSWMSVGTNDARTWFGFANYISQHGIETLYHSYKLFNHPPLMGLFSEFALWFSEPSVNNFFFYLRLPGIVMECVVAFLLFDIWRNRTSKKDGLYALVLFSFSLVSILVSGYHGNTDAIYAGFVLLALYLAEEKRAHFWAGIAFAAALNVKIIPLLLLVPFLALYREKKDALRFLFGLTLGSTPFIVMFINVGEDFYSNVFGYNSFPAYWGLQGILHFLLVKNLDWADVLMQCIEVFREYGRYLILLSIVALSLFARFKESFNRYQLLALSYALFAIFAPGFAPQYFILFPPLVLACSLKWGGWLSFIFGSFVALTYYSALVGYVPLESVHTGKVPYIELLKFEFLIWLLICLFFVVNFIKWKKKG